MSIINFWEMEGKIPKIKNSSNINPTFSMHLEPGPHVLIYFANSGTYVFLYQNRPLPIFSELFNKAHL